MNVKLQIMVAAHFDSQYMVYYVVTGAMTYNNEDMVFAI